MKDLMSKEHYCYKIHTLLMKSSAYPPYYRQLSYIENPAHPLPIFTMKFWSPSSMIFQKSQPPINKAVECTLRKLMMQKKSAKPLALRSLLPTD